jgi:hypothetical protein
MQPAARRGPSLPEVDGALAWDGGAASRKRPGGLQIGKINDPIGRRKQAYDRRMRVNVIALE